jgi:hypothetical protein
LLAKVTDFLCFCSDSGRVLKYAFLKEVSVLLWFDLVCLTKIMYWEFSPQCDSFER